MRKYFGTDGIRGVANREITAGLALRLGAAAAKVLLSRPHGVSVLVGRDPRISGDMIESALAAGFASRGADVILVGVIPTPGVAYLVKETDADFACVISASHNSVEYNGIKFFGPDGEKLPDATELEIEKHLDDPLDEELPIGKNIGRFFRRPERLEFYIEGIKKSLRTDLTGLKLVVDAGNGAASVTAPRVLRELGAEVVELACAPDGVNINEHCGSLYPEKMLQAVVEEKADAGLCFDGDADRVIMGDANGKAVDGDAIMAILGIYLSSRGELPGDRVVATVMSNMGLEIALREHGLLLDRTEEVGDRYVAERMRLTGAAIGGEKSGHIILARHTTTGDGLLTGLQVLAAMNSQQKTLSELAAVITEYPQVLKSVRVARREGWASDSAIQQAVAQAAHALDGKGRIHIRASGTEPVIRVMAEGPDSQEIESLVDGVCGVVRESLGSAV